MVGLPGQARILGRTTLPFIIFTFFKKNNSICFTELSVHVPNRVVSWFGESSKMVYKCCVHSTGRGKGSQESEKKNQEQGW